MNEPENQILKSEIFLKKEHEDVMFFLFKLRGTQKATQFCFRFSKRFLVSPMKLLLFFSLLSDCHSSLFCKESVISVFYSRLPQSFDQNTKQDTTLCSRVSSKNKENISLQSHLSLSLYFYLKNVFGACSNQAQQKLNSRQRFLMWKEKRFNVFSTTLWAKQNVSFIYLIPRDYQLQFIVSCLRPIKLSTLFSRELRAFISVSLHFWSHQPNKA